MRSLGLLCAASLAFAAAGCGGGTSHAHASAKPPGSQAERMRAVVRAWSRHLNAGENAAEASLFALPATMIQGPYVYTLRTRVQVREWHAGLPCSGRIVSIEVHGRYATAVFRLGDRPTSTCDAPGTLAAARFTIVGGRIRVWQQIPPPAPGSVA